MTNHTDQFFVDSAQRTISMEADAVSALSSTLGPSFAAACRHILGTTGRVVVTGMGKSGHIAGKIAATLASTGTPAFFVHPGEASHGDMGMITASDCVIALSNSGSTHEILTLLPLIKRLGIPLISMTGSDTSELAQACASSEVSLPVMLISGMPRRLIRGKSVRISCVLPLLDRAITQSLAVIMPMSPWEASPGCTKKAGVPVLASVAAILPAICPLLPMPVTTTRPVVPRMCRQAAAKDGPSVLLSADTASASMEMVRCAESTKN